MAVTQMVDDVSSAPSAPSSPGRRKLRLTRRGRQILYGYLFLLPALAGLLVFLAYPFGFGLWLTTRKWNVLSPPTPNGFQHYLTLVKDPIFWKSLGNTAYFAVGYVGLATILGLLLAVLLNQRIRGKTVYRTIIYLPVVAATAATAVVWRQIYNTDFGLLNMALRAIGVHGPSWLGNERLAMPSIIFMTVWKGVGFNVILFLAGLQAIPQDYHEAAMVDGAGRWQRFRHITAPLLSPTTFFVVVIGLINSWQVFSQVFIMTKGGPGYATHTIVYLIYAYGFNWFKMGYAAAMAYVLFAIIFVLTLIQIRLQRRWVFYQQ